MRLGSIRHTGQSVVGHSDGHQQHSAGCDAGQRRTGARLCEQVEFGDPFDAWHSDASAGKDHAML